MLRLLSGAHLLKRLRRFWRRALCCRAPAPAHYESDASDQSADGMCLLASGIECAGREEPPQAGECFNRAAPPLQPLAPQCRAFAGLSTHPDAPYAGVYLCAHAPHYFAHAAYVQAKPGDRASPRRAPRAQYALGDGFAPNAASLPDLKNVLAGFFALPIAGAALPAKLLLTGVLENGALKLTLSLPAARPAKGSRSRSPTGMAPMGIRPAPTASCAKPCSSSRRITRFCRIRSEFRSAEPN